MPVTPGYKLPYPLRSDPPDGATQIEQLAEATDTALGTVDGKFIHGGLGVAAASWTGSQMVGLGPYKVVLATPVAQTVGTLTGGNLVINKAGFYLVLIRARTNNTGDNSGVVGSYAQAVSGGVPRNFAGFWSRANAFGVDATGYELTNLNVGDVCSQFVSSSASQGMVLLDAFLSLIRLSDQI